MKGKVISWVYLNHLKHFFCLVIFIRDYPRLFVSFMILVHLKWFSLLIQSSDEEIINKERKLIKI